MRTARPRGSHGERPRRGARISARVRSSAPARRPGAHPTAVPARPEPVTPASEAPPGEGLRAGGSAGQPEHPDDPRVPEPRTPSPRAPSRRRAAGGGGAEAQPRRVHPGAARPAAAEGTGAAGRPGPGRGQRRGGGQQSRAPGEPRSGGSRDRACSGAALPAPLAGKTWVRASGLGAGRGGTRVFAECGRVMWWWRRERPGSGTLRGSTPLALTAPEGDPRGAPKGDHRAWCRSHRVAWIPGFGTPR